MKETIKRIINKLKNKDKLLHFIVNLIVVLSIGWINLPQGSFTEYWKGDIWGLFKNIVEK